MATNRRILPSAVCSSAMLICPDGQRKAAKESDGVGFELLLRRLVSLNVGQATGPVALQAAVQ